MKIRIKFAKRGVMKFIGHLDVMRFFQKVMRRADVDIAYSEGFSPHQIMSFAAPLGVGLTSEGEYLDIEVHSTDSSYEMIERMNATMVDGMQILSYVLLDDNVKNAMSSVAAADYLVSYKDGYMPEVFNSTQALTEAFTEFINKETINVVKKTKKSEKEVNIKPMIYDAYASDGAIFMKLATGSSRNIKPELVMQAFHESLGTSLSPSALNICRLETYGSLLKEITDETSIAEINDNLKPLDFFGKEIC